MKNFIYLFVSILLYACSSSSPENKQFVGSWVNVTKEANVLEMHEKEGTLLVDFNQNASTSGIVKNDALHITINNKEITGTLDKTSNTLDFGDFGTYVNANVYGIYLGNWATDQEQYKRTIKEEEQEFLSRSFAKIKVDPKKGLVMDLSIETNNLTKPETKPIKNTRQVGLLFNAKHNGFTYFKENALLKIEDAILTFYVLKDGEITVMKNAPNYNPLLFKKQ